MENHDKLFEQIKNAASNAEEKDFPALENVWARVEDNLDKKLLKKQNRFWKKLAAAASILLIASLTYQLFKGDVIQTATDKAITIRDTMIAKPVIIPQQNDRLVQADSQDALHFTIDKKTQKAREAVTRSDDTKTQGYLVSSANNDAVVVVADSIYFDKQNQDKIAKVEDRAVSASLKSPVYEAKSVKRTDEGFNAGYSATAEQETVAKNPSLYVVDGKALPPKAASKLNLKNIDSVYVLKEPLYIINGVQYSEADLFGEKPTSPYAPLTAQEIKSVEVLKDSVAIARYGKKGKKGVVIITTKNGQPAKQK
jgi:TonB-dependent SusC/RagA subfamily outer membrane receptor